MFDTDIMNLFEIGKSAPAKTLKTDKEILTCIKNCIGLTKLFEDIKNGKVENDMEDDGI